MVPVRSKPLHYAGARSWNGSHSISIVFDSTGPQKKFPPLRCSDLESEKKFFTDNVIKSKLYPKNNRELPAVELQVKLQMKTSLGRDPCRHTGVLHHDQRSPRRPRWRTQGRKWRSKQQL